MPSGTEYFILVNKAIRDELGLSLGKRVNLELAKDQSKYGMDIPDSFQALLEQDPEGKGYFESLSMGKQRSLIYIVAKVKSLDSQINKGLAILEHLRDSCGKLDFKVLNERIKYYNNRGKIK